MPSSDLKPSRSWFRRTLLHLELGALAGLVTWSLVGASVIVWRYKPAAAEAVSCAPSVNAALGDFTQFQWLSAAGGAAVVMIVGGFSRRKRPAASDTP